MTPEAAFIASWLLACVVLGSVSVMFNKDGKAYEVHPSSECQACDVGEGTQIWRYSYITRDARIGQDCVIGQGCYVEGVLGDRVRLQNGCLIYNTTVIENDVFVGPGVLCLNDKHPPSKGVHYKPILIKQGAYVGGGAVLLPGVTIGENACIGAGAVVTRDVPADVVVAGNPARRLYDSTGRPSS